jgi:hypothetical protein
MKHKNLLFVSILALGLLTMLSAIGTSSADEKKETHYTELATINPPATVSFDISWVDLGSGTYYLADRTATPNTGRVDVIDAESDTLIGTISGFVGNQGRNISGPNGVVVIHEQGKLGAGDGHDRLEVWAGDGDSTIKVAGVEDLAVEDTISTGGKFRADELAYDPADKIIMIANDADTPAFVTFISAESRSVITSAPLTGHIYYDGAVALQGHGPLATGGLEQPAWDPQVRLFYFAVPSTDTNPNGEVDEIDPRAQKITRRFPTSCNPAGLALLPGQRLITSCGDVLSAKTGAILKSISGVAADEIWYNSGDNRVYFGHEPVYVVDADSYEVVTSFDAGTTHSVAAYSKNNHIFVPVNGKGTSTVFTTVGVTAWSADEDQDGDK